MKVSELGEFGLIDLINRVVTRSPKAGAAWERLVIGIGDDAAAWRTDRSLQLATTDTLVEGVHFNLRTTTWRELGWKSLAINLSDIAAMGGAPGYALVALSLPGGTEAEDIVALYRGMLELARRHGVAIVGGNISSAPQVVITLTVLGTLGGKRRHPLRRSAARPGDLLAVTGRLGLSAGGLAMLSRGLIFDDATVKLLRRAHLRPAPRVREGQALLECGVRCAIDVSDGLVGDLGHICEASGVSARVRIDRLPLHRRLKAAFPGECLAMALHGGEDYELLFSAGPRVMARVKETVACPISIIGEVTGPGRLPVTLVDGAGRTIPLCRTGWDHFKSQPEKAG